MSWLRANSFVAGFAATVVLIGGALVFLLMQSMAQYHEALDAYTQAVRKLHILQNRSPFPNVENFEKSRVFVEQYKSGLASLRAQLAKMQPPVSPDMQPQKFQDNLRTAVNQITEKARAAGVELPKGFYLGFAQYANSLPSEHAAPALARQLGIIEKIVTDLIDFKVHSVDSLDRLPLPEESAAAAAAPKSEEPQRGGNSGTKPSGFRRLPFDLAFTAEQGKLRLAFNSLLDSDRFLIVRNLALQNTARIGPPVFRQSGTGAAPSKLATNHPAAPAEQASGGSIIAQGDQDTASELNVILGRELVKAAMRIEIIDFSPASEPRE
jgi:hypothetical protein